jgi:hypothetical protein
MDGFAALFQEGEDFFSHAWGWLGVSSGYEMLTGVVERDFHAAD